MLLVDFFELLHRKNSMNGSINVVLQARPFFFYMYLDGKKGLVKWAVWIGDAFLRIRISKMGANKS